MQCGADVSTGKFMCKKWDRMIVIGQPLRTDLMICVTEFLSILILTEATFMSSLVMLFIVLPRRKVLKFTGVLRTPLHKK